MPANGIIAIIRFNRAFAFTFAITLAISFLCLTAVLAASADSRVAVAIACNANTVVPMDSDANAPSSQKTNTVFFNIASMTNTFAYLGSHHVHRLWGLWVSVWVVSVRR
jgi:hypothetical protein